MIGLGLMGFELAQRLIQQGWNVVGYDVDPDRTREHGRLGGDVAESPKSVAERSSRIVLSLPNSKIVRDACFGEDGLIAADTPLLLIDTTTSRPQDCVNISSELRPRGVHFVDACLSGPSSAVRNGDIVALVGGEAADTEHALPIINDFAKSVHRMGAVGSGSTTKLVVNLTLGLQRLALAEALVLAENSGLALDSILAALKDSTAYSRAMDIWGDRMVSARHDEPTSRIRQHHKDISIIMEHGGAVSAPLLSGAVELQLLQSAVATGLGDLDNSAIIEVIRRLTGKGQIT